MPYKLRSHADRRHKSLKAKYDTQRGNAASRGYDRQWQRVRAVHLSEHPLCERCAIMDITTAATLVHHVTPIADDPSLRLVYSNLMSLCERCHAAVHGEGAKNR